MSRPSHRIARQSNWQIFRIPLLLVIVSLMGLVLGLTGDGWRDGVAWALLSIPILVAFAAWRRRH